MCTRQSNLRSGVFFFFGVFVSLAREGKKNNAPLPVRDLKG